MFPRNLSAHPQHISTGSGRFANIVQMLAIINSTTGSLLPLKADGTNNFVSSTPPCPNADSPSAAGNTHLHVAICSALTSARWQRRSSICKCKAGCQQTPLQKAASTGVAPGRCAACSHHARRVDPPSRRSLVRHHVSRLASISFHIPARGSCSCVKTMQGLIATGVTVKLLCECIRAVERRTLFGKAGLTAGRLLILLLRPRGRYQANVSVMQRLESDPLTGLSSTAAPLSSAASPSSAQSPLGIWLPPSAAQAFLSAGAAKSVSVSRAPAGFRQSAWQIGYSGGVRGACINVIIRLQ